MVGTRRFSECPQASFWSKRNTLSPEEVALRDKRKFWFKCNVCPHEFETVLYSVARGVWCPYCSNRKRCSPETIMHCEPCLRKCFGSHPRASSWSSRNTLSAWEVARGSLQKFWFKCEDCSHEFDAALNDVGKGSWCPFCQGLKRCHSDVIKDCQACWSKCFASHPKAVNWSTKNDISPSQVSLKNLRKFWFTCDVCPHEFEISLQGVANGAWCNYCSGLKMCPPEVIQTCPPCREKAFGSHPRASSWSTRNKITAWEVSRMTDGKFWFACNACPHEFEAAVSNISKGMGCPYCAHKKLCPPKLIRRCRACFTNSFASHPRAAFWSARNDVSPLEVFLNDNQKFWFSCNVCPHEFEQRLYSITRGQFCSYCANRHRCPPDKIRGCAACFSKCFGAHPQSQFWSERNSISPLEVALNDNRKYWFRCGTCPHEFEAALSHVVEGAWCALCKMKTQNLVHSWCREWDNTAEPEATFEWCTSPDSGRYLRFDIYLPAHRLIVEVDGPQHFRNVGNWGDNLLERQQRDVYKMACSVQAGLRLIRVFQPDVWADRDKWKLKLQVALEKITQTKIQMLANDESVYDEHRRLAQNVLLLASLV